MTTGHASRSTRFWLPLAGAGIATVLVAVVHAVGIPDGTVIHGCYHKSDGTLRVVDSPTKCKNSEIPLDWSQTGPQGPAGTNGVNGLNGADGEDGAPGLSGLVRVQEDAPFDGVATKEVIAACPEGKKVIGGGYLHFLGGPTVVPRTNTPTIDLDAWIVDATEFTGADWSISAVALCATVAD